MRRTTAPLLILLAVPGPGLAQAIDDPVEAQRAELRAVIRPVCPRGGAEEEIVVCGRRDDSDRYRLAPQIVPVSTPAGARAGGEQRAAMAANDQRCSTVGRDQQCSGGLDVIGIGFTIARAVAQAIARGD
jgi:hypothetical protein